MSPTDHMGLDLFGLPPARSEWAATGTIVSVTCRGDGGQPPSPQATPVPGIPPNGERHVHPIIQCADNAGSKTVPLATVDRGDPVRQAAFDARIDADGASSRKDWEA
jgi:hypothetical protein